MIVNGLMFRPVCLVCMQTWLVYSLVVVYGTAGRGIVSQRLYGNKIVACVEVEERMKKSLVDDKQNVNSAKLVETCFVGLVRFDSVAEKRDANVFQKFKTRAASVPFFQPQCSFFLSGHHKKSRKRKIIIEGKKQDKIDRTQTKIQHGPRPLESLDLLVCCSCSSFSSDRKLLVDASLDSFNTSCPTSCCVVCLLSTTKIVINSTSIRAEQRNG